MGYERYALVLDHADGHLGPVAMRLLELGVDVLYANDADEATLLALQESANLGAVLAPASSSLPFLERALDRICAPLPAGSESLVLIGRDPGESTVRELRKRGVRWALWEPVGEREMRFLLTTVMSHAFGGEQRKHRRVPTDFQGAVWMGRHRKDVTVHDLSISGAYLAAPHPFLAESRLTIELSLADGGLMAKGTVVWARTADAPARDDVPEGMGVAFTDLGDAARARLERFTEAELARFEL